MGCKQQHGCKPRSTHEATQYIVHILDAKHEEAEFQAVVGTTCTHLTVQDQNKLLDYSQNMRNVLMEHHVIGTLSPSPLN